MVLILSMYAKHQKKRSHCECAGCKRVRKLVERGMKKGWQFPFED